MSQPQCRWGFLSTASIGQKNWLAIKNSGNSIVVAVASRNREKAQTFIDQCQPLAPFESCPESVEGYASLLERQDIDAVYIPLPTGMRKEWVIKAAEAGKHVMCEKPCAINANELEEMVAACRENNVQFMDGVMYVHSARLRQIREALDSPENVGTIKRIASQFSFFAPEEFKQGNIRTDSRLEPHGCLGDLGWYTIRFALFVMQYQMPTRVSGRILEAFQRDGSPDPVPMEFSGELFFENGVTASFYNSFVTQHQQWANVSGTNGHLHVNDFVLPYFGNESKFTVTNADFVVEGCDFRMENHARDHMVNEFSNSHASAQESLLFRCFSERVLSGQPDMWWADVSLKTQRIMDACFHSAQNDGRMTDVT